MNEREILLYNSLKGLYLLDRAPKLDVLRGLMGLQAQFARNPRISLWLRASDYDPEAWSEGLVKTWSHRGTIHVIPEDELGLHLSAADRLGELTETGWGFGRDDAARWAPFILDEVRQGNATRNGLKSACLAAGMDDALLKCVFHGWGGLIKELCWRGQLAVVPGMEKAYLIPREVRLMPRDAARRVFLQRYFERFGPATREDCRHFFGGWRAGEVNPLFEALLPTLRQTRIDGRTYYHARPLVEDAALPDCVLTPGFDQLALGYRDRSRMIDRAHLPRLVNGAGIVFPMVILRGRMRATWKIEGSAIVVSPFQHLLKKDEAAVRREVRKRFAPALRRVVFLPEG